MRQQVFIDRRSRGVWQEAREAADADGLSLSGFVAVALSHYLAARRRRIAHGHSAVTR